MISIVNSCDFFVYFQLFVSDHVEHDGFFSGALTTALIDPDFAGDGNFTFDFFDGRDAE